MKTNTARTRVFLAEDDDDDYALFREALSDIHANAELTRLRDGEELMDRLSNTPLPHVIFLDLNMPRKNGYECLAEIRSSARLSYLPVVIFSTNAKDQFINKMIADDAQHYIQKPYFYGELKQVIEKVLYSDWEWVIAHHH